MEKEKSVAIEFLKWSAKSCTPLTTSRNNIYKLYWQLHDTGVLYTDEELFYYWNVNVKDNV